MVTKREDDNEGRSRPRPQFVHVVDPRYKFPHECVSLKTFATGSGMCWDCHSGCRDVYHSDLKFRISGGNKSPGPKDGMVSSGRSGLWTVTVLVPVDRRDSVRETYSQRTLSEYIWMLALWLVVPRPQMVFWSGILCLFSSTEALRGEKWRRLRDHFSLPTTENKGCGSLYVPGPWTWSPRGRWRWRSWLPNHNILTETSHWSSPESSTFQCAFCPLFGKDLSYSKRNHYSYTTLHRRRKINIHGEFYGEFRDTRQSFISKVHGRSYVLMWIPLERRKGTVPLSKTKNLEVATQVESGKRSCPGSLRLQSVTLLSVGKL